MTGFFTKLARAVCASALLAAASFTAQAQDLGSPTTVTFDAAAFANGGQLIANPYADSSFTFTFSGSPVIGDGNDGDGGTDAIASLGATQNETLRIDYSGDEFDFNAFYFVNTVSAVTLQVRGYDVSNAQVASQTFNASIGSQTLTMTDAGFNDVNYVIITGTSANGFDNGFFDTLAFDAPSAADATAPRVSSIVRQTPATATTSADSLVFRVTFDEPVQNVDTSDFTASGTSGAATGVSAQSTSIYDVTVSGGDLASFTGTVSLGFAGGQNISDTPAGNALTNTTPTGANESYTLDNTAPSAPSTPDLTAGSDTGSSSTDDITNDTTPTFTGTAEANATVTVISSVGGTLGTTTADGSGNWSYTAGSALASGAHTITATATDAVGNTSSASSALSITIDTTAPDITSITRLSPTGQTISASAANAAFRVTYSEAIAGSSQADYAFQNVSGTAAGSVSSYGTSSPTLINVQLGTLSGDGDFSITLNGGHGITDIAGNALSSTTPTGVREVFTRDGTAPSTTSFVRTTPAGATTSSDSLVFTANYSESVSGVDTSDFAVTGTTATVQSVSAASGTSIAITVSGGDLASYNGTVGLNYAAAPTITDAAGNALPNTEPATDETYTLDNTAPAGYSVTLDDDPVNAGNQTATSFTFAGAEVAANYNYTISSSGGGANVTGSGTISTATDQISGIDVSGLGDGTLTLSVTLTDGAGNAGSAATDTATKEAQPPQVNSIVVAGSPAGNATSVDFTVTFSEAAQNISTDDFSLTTTGTAAGTIASVSSATGTTVTVTVNTISGDGTIRLDLDAATNIQDAVGNSGPNAYTSGATHTVDNTAPAAFNVAFQAGLITQANETSNDIRFTTAETGTTYAYSISSSGGGTPVTGTGTITTATQDVTVNVSSLPDGTLTLTATLTDGAGNVTNQSSADTVSKATAVPGFSMAFAPASVLTGGTSTATFTIDNSAIGVAATSLDVSNNLPAGVTVATTPNASTTCTGGTLTATNGANSLAYTGGTVSAGASCTVSVDVTASTTGAKANTTGNLTSNLGNSGTASATLTVTQPSLSVDDPSVLEGDAGTATLTFTVTMAPASSQTITVDYATSDGTATAGSDYTAATGTLTFNPSVTTQTVSVTVTSDATIEPDETVILTLSNPSNATIGDATGTGTITTDDVAPTDFTAPTLDLVSRASPTDERTNVNALTWVLEFSEAVRRVDVTDFAVTGSTASVSAISGSGRVYQVTVSGGDLAGYDGVVGLELPNPTIVDLAGNDLDGGAPSSAETYLLDNTGPVATLSSDLTGDASEPFTVTVAFDEPATGLQLSDFVLTNASVNALRTVSETEFTVEITPGGRGELTVSLAAGAVTDALGNESLASDTLTFETDTSGPGLSGIQSGVGSVTALDIVYWNVTFSEEVTGVTRDVFSLSGGTNANLSVSGSGASYQVTASGGSLADFDGVIALSISDPDAILDLSGNAYEGGAPSGPDQSQIRIDNTAPVATLSSEKASVGAAVTVTVRFSEDVRRFGRTGVTLTNASLEELTEVSPSEYTLVLAAQSNSPVSVQVKAGSVIDAAGNANPASSTLTLAADGEAPVLRNVVAGTDLRTADDTLSWTVEFDEDVTGVDASGFTLAGASGVSLSVSGSGRTYTVTASGGNLADLDGEVQLQLVTPSSIVDVWGNAFAGEGPTNTDESRIELDNSGPAATLTALSDEVVGPFTLTIAFDEDVTDLALSDLAVTNGEASNLSRIDTRSFRVAIQPQTFGVITMTVAAGAVEDLLGNPSDAGELSVEAVSQQDEIDVEVNIDVTSPVGAQVQSSVSNPGVTDVRFSASADVGWLTVTPAQGVIPAGASVEFTVTVNDQAAALEAGDYTGTVTVVREGVSGGASAGRAGVQAVQETVLARIPVNLMLVSQKGSLQIVSTTPSGVSGDADFTYASSLSQFDGLTLTTVNGYAQSTSVELNSAQVSLQQTSPAGWRVESISCAGDLDGGSQVDLATGTIQIDLDPEENLVCTFENVRDEAAVQLATQRAIRNFMLRRADRLIDAAPDLSTRLSARESMGAGQYAANVDQGRYTMSLTASLAGARNQAKARHSDAPGMPSSMRDDVGRLDVWLSAELSGVSDNRAGERAESDFGVAQLGLDWAVSDALLVGAMVQMDWMDETAQEVFEEAGAITGARVDGEGWMAGPYVVWRVADSVILDGLALYGTSSNTVNPLGLYEDEFETDRWMLQANLTGEYGRGAFLVRPQATLTHFEETQDGYTDSLGFVIPSQSIALGRLAAGPELVWRQERASGARWELRSKLRAVWDYQPAELLSETGAFMNSESDLRADGEIGVAATLSNGAVFELSVGVSGIGQEDFEANSARFQLRYPLSLGQ